MFLDESLMDYRNPFMAQSLENFLIPKAKDRNSKARERWSQNHIIYYQINKLKKQFSQKNCGKESNKPQLLILHHLLLDWIAALS